MNTLPCGAPHHLYPDTLCTEPAGHYRRDRDPHAGPLIVGGRERGGAAWDEPKDRRMSDRHTADTITDDALDALYEQLNEARQWARHGYEIGQRHCGWSDHGVAPAWLTEGWPPHIDSCEHLQQMAEFDMALTRVRAVLADPAALDWRQRIREALDGPAPAATEATDDEHLGGHPAQPGAPRCTATWQIPDTGQLARCWRPADHNTSPGYQTHMGETEQGSRHQWIGTEPGAVPHRDAIDQPKEQ
jgi:hypothetical protein